MLGVARLRSICSLSLTPWDWRGAAAAVGVLTMLATTQPGRAQTVGNAPWCIDLGDLGWGVAECQYFTFEQCHQRAWGVTNVCFPNPWYVPGRPPGPRPRRSRHK